MKTIKGLFVLGLIAVSGAISMADAPTIQDNIKVKDRYEGKNGTSVEILGVGTYNESQTRVWDLTGKPNKALDELMAFFKKTIIDRTPEILRNVPLERTRWMFARLKSDNLRSNWMFDKKNNGFSWYMKHNTDPGYTDVVVQLTVGKDTKQVEPEAYIIEPQAKTVTLDRLNKQKTAQLNELAYSFADICSFQPAHESQSGTQISPTHKEPLWTILLNQLSPSTRRDSLITYGVLDLSGKPVLYVDEKGNPVSEKTYKSDPVEDATDGKQHKYRKALFAVGRLLDDAQAIITNVNQARIKDITFTFNPVQKVTFDPVLVEPK